ncbi:MAG TPA: hypothetical protein DCX89_02360 [Saprospirales bacterium]|nr:hypothetical protein [Saprospirales bacterium]HAY70712.1 hypothetical protein [Saprospirales bacterium]
MCTIPFKTRHICKRSQITTAKTKWSQEKPVIDMPFVLQFGIQLYSCLKMSMINARHVELLP